MTLMPLIETVLIVQLLVWGVGKKCAVVNQLIYILHNILCNSLYVQTQVQHVTLSYEIYNNLKVIYVSLPS